MLVISLELPLSKSGHWKMKNYLQQEKLLATLPHAGGGLTSESAENLVVKAV